MLSRAEQSSGTPPGSPPSAGAIADVAGDPAAASTADAAERRAAAGGSVGASGARAHSGRSRRQPIRFQAGAASGKRTEPPNAQHSESQERGMQARKSAMQARKSARAGAGEEAPMVATPAAAACTVDDVVWALAKLKGGKTRWYVCFFRARAPHSLIAGGCPAGRYPAQLAVRQDDGKWEVSWFDPKRMRSSA